VKAVKLYRTEMGSDDVDVGVCVESNDEKWRVQRMVGTGTSQLGEYRADLAGLEHSGCKNGRIIHRMIMEVHVDRRDV